MLLSIVNAVAKFEQYLRGNVGQPIDIKVIGEFSKMVDQIIRAVVGASK